VDDRGPKLLRILEQPSARLLRSLSVPVLAEQVLSALAARPRPSLRSLSLDAIPAGGEAPLSKAFPGLRSLLVWHAPERPDQLELPALEELAIRCPTDPAFRPPPDAPGYRILDERTWTAFASGAGLPRLKTLRLVDHRAGALKILARSPLCARLETLAVTGQAIDEILESADHLRHLLIDGGGAEMIDGTERQLERLKLRWKGFRDAW
jgi:hypothetical protein